MAIVLFLVCLWWTFGYVWRRARARARWRRWGGWAAACPPLVGRWVDAAPAARAGADQRGPW